MLTEVLEKPIGWIDYLNLHPFRCELEKKHNFSEMKFGVPREINSLIRSGDVILGPASSVSLLKHECMEQALPLGISAGGAVKSVYLGMNGPICDVVQGFGQRIAMIKEIFEHSLMTNPFLGQEFGDCFWSEVQDLPSTDFDWTKWHLKVKFSEQSETSVLLTKIFLRSTLFNKVKTREELNQHVNTPSSKDGGVIELLIGNDALKRKSQFKYVLDLSSFWTFISGMPFVFAVWQKKRGLKVPSVLSERILKAGIDAQFKMKSSPQLYLSESLLQQHEISESSLIEYWRLIDYVLEPKDIESLKAYFSLGRSFLEKYDVNYMGKLAKWSEKIQSFSSNQVSR